MRDDARHRVGALDNACGGEGAYAVCPGVDADERRCIVPFILQSIGIQFCSFLEKPAEQGFSLVPLAGHPLRFGLRLSGHPRGCKRRQATDCRPGSQSWYVRHLHRGSPPADPV
jgi:hypothetical protein